MICKFSMIFLWQTLLLFIMRFILVKDYQINNFVMKDQISFVIKLVKMARCYLHFNTFGVFCRFLKKDFNRIDALGLTLGH